MSFVQVVAISPGGRKAAFDITTVPGTVDVEEVSRGGSVFVFSAVGFVFLLALFLESSEVQADTNEKSKMLKAISFRIPLFFTKTF